ncbi:MAG: anaerobic glycerol-3-phosphate dehydrogenase subunit GlpB, partial [Deltaproteobacteria bacterium]|nr:anaerobic glycerol-3-phosphate dehydrogenase subunit GlpB [Deltaproteobacteria bacterium]
PATSKTPLTAPASEIKRVPAQHPYGKVGAEGLWQALAHFQKILESENYPYEGSGEKNILIPTSLGSLHPTGLVPETLRQGDLSAPGSALLLGFEGLKDFFPHFAAKNLNLLPKGGRTAPVFRAALLKRPDLGEKALNGLSLASAFEKEEFRASIAKEMRFFLRPGERLGLPAVLGIESPRKVWSDLQERVGAPIFEIPLPPPSVPGLRLQSILRSNFQKKGGRLFIGFSELAPLIEKSRIVALTLGDSRKNAPHRASAFVLATGQFVGGGLDSERNRVFETLFGLPLRYPENRKEWFHSTLLTPAGQPFNGFGVEVDRNLQPVDLHGEVVYSNLFAAGGIIAHGDSMNEKSGGGIAVSTGYKAGKLAAEFAQNI